MKAEERDAELTHLNNVLTDFEQKLTRCDENYSFFFSPYDKSETAEDVFRDYLEELSINIWPPRREIGRVK